jgi:drug/metabolite transporter (DMT)-like permease
MGTIRSERLAARAPAPVLILAAALAAVTIWGGTPVVTKLAVAGLSLSEGALAVGLLRTLLAAAVALPLLVAGRLAPPASSGGRICLVVATLGGYVGFPLLFTLGVARTSAAHGALLLALLPLFTGLMAAVLERRLPGRLWWLGAALALAGCLLLIDQRFGLAAPGASLEGDLLVILSCLCASAGYVAGAHAGREAGSWAITLWGVLLGGLLLLPLAVLLPLPLAVLLPLPLAVLLPLPALLAQASQGITGAGLWAALLYLSLLSTLLAYAAWYWALGQGGVGRTGLLQFAQPLVGLALAGLLLGEALTWPLLLAAAMILAGMAMARLAPTQ